MRLGEAELDHDAFLACLTHTLTTEQEEVMGLLLGDIEECNGVRVARVWDAITLRRNCKQRDRVEISAEQLVAASQEAEEIGNRINKPTRVIGWYHSHPHITVLPSHVDIGTQKSYQMMEGGFLGLIFSVFNTDQNHVRNYYFDVQMEVGISQFRAQKGRIQVIAFQSGISEEQSAGGINFPDGMIQIPLRLAPSLGSTPNLFLRLANLQEILLEEAHDSFLQSFPQG